MIKIIWHVARPFYVSCARGKLHGGSLLMYLILFRIAYKWLYFAVYIVLKRKYF